MRIIFLLIRKCFSVAAVKHNTSCLFTLKLHVMIRCTLNVYAPFVVIGVNKRAFGCFWDNSEPQCIHAHARLGFPCGWSPAPLFVPAAVVAGMSLERAGSAGQSHTSKGVVVGERRVRQACGSVCLCLVDVLPVGLQTRCSRGESSEQVGVQLADDLLTDAGLKLSGEEGGSGRLLRSGETRRGGMKICAQ